MESIVIETLGCPLDPDVLKLWEQSSLESFHSHTSSDHSESSDEENEIKNDDLIEQLKNLSFENIPHSKYITSKCSNKISGTNFQDEDNPEDLKFVENKKIEENRSSSSSIKNEEFSKFVVEGDIQSTFCKWSNKNCGINSKEENKTEKLSFEENMENVENQLSSLSIKTSSGISAGDESDSDDDEQGESAILRERDPTRHNRTENNKQLRKTPFSRNHTKTSKPNLNSNNSQTFRNFSSHILYDFNSSHYCYDSINHINSTDIERYGIVSPRKTFHSAYPTSDSVAYETFEDIVPNTVTDQTINNAIPCTAENEVVNGIFPCTVTKQIVDGVIPFTVDAVLDGVVPYTNDFGNSNDTFSEEINDTLRFDNLKEKIFSDCAVTNVEKETFLDSYFEDLTTVEVDKILKIFTDSTLDDVSSQNHVNFIEESSLHLLSSKEVEKVLNNSTVLNQNILAASTVKETNYPNNNQHNLHPEPDHRHNSFSQANVEETLLFSNLSDENYILETSSRFYNSENLVNKPDNYSNLVCKNITSINCESLTPKTSDYRIISNEIEHEIVKWKEMKEWVNKEQKNASESPCNINWNVFPFDELDEKAISECINTPRKKMSNTKNDSKRKNINQTSKSPCKAEKIKICWMLGTAARDKLFNTSSFCKIKWERENEEIRQQIKSGKLGTNEKKVIHVLKRNRKTKYRGTNLHYAILSENIEKVFCIVECHKECHDGINEINLRDSFKKTVLDYSKEKGIELLTDYLEENTAKVSINFE
ncbi:unnamed protein product [Larinioides sclopetarius]|uniref:Uncharacterized protein n=1 Tax=Larinioides sclopetarius TaxID=280406 RepID=A0AAV2AEV1_9ARAC